MRRQARSRRLYLPPTVWAVLVVCAALAVWLQTTETTGDRGMSNVLTFLVLVVSALTAGVWFVFLGPAPRRLRWGIGAGFVAFVALFFTLFRIAGVGGEMAPRFVWRLAEDADRALEVSAATPAEPVDLTSTGPWDFPQFLGPDRDVSVSVVELDPDWDSSPPALVWRQPIGAGWSGFAIVNGYALTQEQRGDFELVTCYQLETGALMWSYSIENRFESVVAGNGPRATPTVDEGIVYALTSDGTLLALAGDRGTLLWQRDLAADYGLTREQELATIPYGRSNSPLIVDSLVIVPAGGNTSRRLVSLVAFDKKTGEMVWEGGNRQISQSSPAIATVAGVEQVLVLNEASVSGHYVESGALLWEFPRPAVTAADPNVSQAVAVPPNRVFVSKGYGLGGALLELTPRFDGTMAVEEVWSNGRVMRTKFSNVTIHEGYIYGLSDGILECVELDTGERVWKHGRYHQGQILRVHDLLLVLSEDGGVFLVEATPDRRDSVLGQFHALSGKTWNNFALYGPYLAVRNGQEAAVFRLPLAGERGRR